MTLSNQKKIIKHFVDAHNRQDLDALRNLLAPNFKAHIAGMDESLGLKAYLEGVKMAHQAFSNLTFTIQDIIEEGEKVTVRILAQGRHTGEYMGIQPTNKTIQFNAIAIRHIVDGKVIEEWQTNDHLTLFRHLGRLSETH